MVEAEGGGRGAEARVKYLVRLNPRAVNPITKTVIESRLWEVEQCASRDMPRIIWHCADVRINTTPIRELFTLPTKSGEAPWEGEFWGICVRGQDDVVEILTGPHDASGN